MFKIGFRKFRNVDNDILFCYTKSVESNDLKSSIKYKDKSIDFFLVCEDIYKDCSQEKEFMRIY